MNERKGGGPVVDPLQAVLYINRNKARIYDLRTHDAYMNGSIANAEHVEASKAKDTITKKTKSKEAYVVLLCNTGRDSRSTSASLIADGYTNVYAIKGGDFEWQRSGLPFVAPKGRKAVDTKAKDKE